MTTERAESAIPHEHDYLNNRCTVCRRLRPRFPDRDTTTVEAAARLERDRSAIDPVVIGGHPFDPDDRPSRDEL